MTRARGARVAVAAGLLALAGAAHAQTGPFTEAQAAAGRSSYFANCVGCHMADLRGSNEARPLVEDGTVTSAKLGPRTPIAGP